MKVLVTGGSGFTGKHLVRTLAERGNSIRILTRNRARSGELEAAGIEVVEGDIADSTIHAPLCRDIDTIYHLAALYREAGVPKSRYFEVNTEGTRHLIDAAVRNGVKRFVHCSTVGVMGDVGMTPADEKTAYNPGDHYQASKCEGEKIALDAAGEGGIPIVVIRPTAIYGPEDKRLLKLFRMIYRRRFILLGDGSIYYHMVYVTDLVEGLLLASKAENRAGEVYIVGGEEALTLAALARLISEVLDVPLRTIRLPLKPFQIAGTFCEAVAAPFGLSPPLYRRRVDFYAKSRIFSIEKARTELGYRPAVRLREGLARTARWYQTMKLL